MKKQAEPRAAYPTALDERDEIDELIDRAFEEAEETYRNGGYDLEGIKPAKVRVAKDVKHVYSFRALPEELDFIGDAADLAGVDMSTFTRGAALREARSLVTAERGSLNTKEDLVTAKEAIERAILALTDSKGSKAEAVAAPRRRKRAS